MPERYTGNPLHDRRHMLSYEFQPSADLAKELRRITPEASQTARVYADALRFISVSEETFASEAFQSSLVRARKMFSAVELALYISPEFSRENGMFHLFPYYPPAYNEATRPLLNMTPNDADRHDGEGYIAFTAATQESPVDDDAVRALSVALKDERVRRRYYLKPVQIRVDSNIPS